MRLAEQQGRDRGAGPAVVALTVALLVAAGLSTSPASAQEPVSPQAAQAASFLLRGVPETIHSQGYATGLTDVFEAAVTAGVQEEPRLAAAVGFDASAAEARNALRQALVRGLPRVTGLDLPANLPTIQREQNQRAVARLQQIQLSGAPIEPASRVAPREGMSFAADGANPDPSAEWFDWRNLGRVTAAKDQKTCGCCWAFATAGAYEASFAIRNRGLLVDVSDQFLLNCNGKGYSCGGGLWAYDVMQSTGALSTRQLRYSDPPAQQGCSNPGNNRFKVRVWGFVSPTAGIPSVAELKRALCEHGPLTVGIDANESGNLLRYKGGTFSEFRSGYADPRNPSLHKANHAIVIVGWDDARIGANEPDRAQKTVWAIKNSWGRGWGVDQGFGWVRSDTNNIGVAASWVEASPEGGLQQPGLAFGAGAVGDETAPPRVSTPPVDLPGAQPVVAPATAPAVPAASAEDLSPAVDEDGFDREPPAPRPSREPPPSAPAPEVRSTYPGAPEAPAASEAPAPAPG